MKRKKLLMLAAILALVNAVIARMKADGTLRRLHERYGLVYAYM